MFTLNLPKGTALLVDSAYRLPEYRRTEYAFYNLVHSAIGSTLGDVDRHFDTLQVLGTSGDVAAFTNAFNNMRYLFYGMLHKQLAPNILALCCLVDTVDGERCDDYSSQGVEELARKLSDLGICQEHADAIKPLYDKLLKPLQRAFPLHFLDTGTQNDERIQRALLVELDEILQPDDPSLEARRRGVEKEFVESIKPPQMNGKGNAPDAIRDAYQKNKFLLLSEGLPVDDQTPAFTFWSYLSQLEAKYRRQSGK